MLAMLVPVGGGLMIVPIGGAVDPGFGIPGFSVGRPGHDLPWAPARPGHDLPMFPGHPGHDLPMFPGTPGNALPPLPPDMAHPGHPLPLPPEISNGLPIRPASPGHELPPPGMIWPPLPPTVPSGKALALVAISGVGYRWTVIDTSLSAGWPVPPPTAGTPLPPAPAPK
jgi:hypothetical protein